MSLRLLHFSILPSAGLARVAAALGKYEWLLFLHMTGAFLFLGAAVASLIFTFASQRYERPSEIALILRLASYVVPAFAIGGLLLLVFGIWLVSVAGYDYSQGWVIAALVLFILSNVAGAVGGKRAEPARELAERLAPENDVPSTELKARLRDPVALTLDYGAAVLGFAVLVLMIWKPGAGG
jgi:uncharacterized membrane protein